MELRALLKGKTIQWKSKVDNYMGWENMTPLMDFNFTTVDYRIKPLVKVRPYALKEMCEAVKTHGGYIINDSSDTISSIVRFDKEGVLADAGEFIYDELVDYKYRWFDEKSPCGVIEEE